MELFSSTGREITNELTKSEPDECYKENTVRDAGERWFPVCSGTPGYLLETLPSKNCFHNSFSPCHSPMIMQSSFPAATWCMLS